MAENQVQVEAWPCGCLPQNPCERHREGGSVTKFKALLLPEHEHTIEPGEVNRRGCRRCLMVSEIRAAHGSEIEARQNELYLAMGLVESTLPASEEATALIVKLGERMRLLVELLGKSEVGRTLP